MDNCPNCGHSCPVRSTTMRSTDNIFICWDCHLSWRPGSRWPTPYPLGTAYVAPLTPKFVATL